VHLVVGEQFLFAPFVPTQSVVMLVTGDECFLGFTVLFSAILLAI
jgi:hypothetical protein